jgi:hypothetical protein
MQTLLKTVRPAFLAVCLGTFAASSALLVHVDSAQAQSARVVVSIFFDDLQPYGSWVHHDRYNYIWVPTVDVNWSPYTHGHWEYIQGYGWYFQSDESFASVVYHYGRWSY